MEALHTRSHLRTGEESVGPNQPQSQSGKSPQPFGDHQPPKSPSSQKHQPQTQQTRSKQGGHQQQHQQHHGQHQHSKLPNKRERKRLRPQRPSVDSDTPPVDDGKHAKAEAASNRVSQTSTDGSPSMSSSSFTCIQSTEGPATENQGGTLKQKHERKPGKPGKYVCSYCGRACAKPSVLQKHIRSHTGERPYPCGPCGFSFKTKSNLYKHRKSHTHRVKAGLASGEPSSLEEPVTESEDETRQSSTAASTTLERQGNVADQKTHGDTERSTEQSTGTENSYAIKKRLAMRLSRGKHGPLSSSDSITSLSGVGSRGSTESGYFSRSESTEQSQDSSPNTTSAKSYAEIILGKYGRLGHLQRMSRHQNQQPSGGQSQEGKSIPFTVPKKQVIDHITNLITINEAVVDTSKIDSVKPRRFSLSRRNSTESNSKVPVSQKEPSVVHHSTNNPDEPGFKTSGSITMGVPCEKFHQPQSLNLDPTAGQASTSNSPLLRSLSMPSAAISSDASSGVCPKNFRLSQSFDERSETQCRRFGMLQRQPAIEIPPGAEFTKEEHSLHSSSNTLYNQNMSVVSPEHKQCKPEPYECESCGTGCKTWEGYKAHKRSLCVAPFPQEGLDTSECQLDHSQSIPYTISRPGALAMRKRRKEESFESDDPSSTVSLSSPTLSTSVQDKNKVNVAGNQHSWSRLEQERQGTSKGFSVIQHTSSFEKQDTFFSESKGKEETHVKFPSREDSSQLVPQKQLQLHSSKPTPRKLVRQHNVPEIFVTEDSNTNVIESVQTQSETASIMPKQTERTEEFQWPQRSLTLSGVPIEKLPPKKKRIRLAEAAQSSGESMSSFDSISLPRSPSQDSCASHASSLSASLEESTRPGDMETLAGTPLRRSRAPNTLTVPGMHHHKREMRRSASEQAPHDPQQQSVLMAMSEMRSKSFDYSSLSPECSVAGWRDRRKCLLIRHTTVRDPEEGEQSDIAEELKLKSSSSTPAKYITLKVNNPSHCSLSPDPVCPSTSFRPSPSKAMSCSPLQTLYQESPSQLDIAQSIQLTGHCSEAPQNPVEYPDGKQRVAPSSLHSGDNLLISLRPVHTYIHPAQPQIHPAQTCSAQPQPWPAYSVPTHYSSGIAKAHYHPMSTGLKLEIPISTRRHDGDSEFITQSLQIPNPNPNIILSPVLLQPSISPTVAVVRLQGDTNTQTCAIYTTRSQTRPLMSQEHMCSGLNSGNRNTTTSEPNSHLAMSLPLDNHLALPLPPGGELWSEEGSRVSGSGSNKRMLSPSNSVDFSPESKQQQKRVKEEEEKESCVSNTIAELSTKEEKVEIPLCLPRGCSPMSPDGLEYPTLQSTTSHSWCYLNYIKPNPSTSTDPQPSVYSSWSTSEYDPNPPGLSSKTAMSLLDCKQRFSPTIYTMSPMSSTPAETPPEPADMKTPCPSEVHATLPGDSRCVNTTEQEPSTEDKEPKKEHELEVEGKEEQKKEDEVQSTSNFRESQIWVSEGGYRSSEEYVCVRGRGRGRHVCGECGVRCKKPSMLRKHLQRHTDSRPYICKHCDMAFKTKGNLTKHIKSKAHGGSEDCSVWSETGQKEHPYSNVGETEEDDKDSQDDDNHRGVDEDHEEDSGSHEDLYTSTSHFKPPKSPDQNKTPPGRDSTRPSHDTESGSSQHQKPSVFRPARSPSKKRVLFSQRSQLDPGSHISPLRSPTPDLSSSPAQHQHSSSSPAHRPPSSSSPGHRSSSSPSPALSPSPASRLPSTPRLSPVASLSPRVSLSPLHCPSPRRYLSPVPSHPSPRSLSSLSPSPSPPSSLSPLGCHVSPSLEKHLPPPRSLLPVRLPSPRSGPPGSPTIRETIPSQHNLPRDQSLNPQKDMPDTATCSKSRLMKSYSVQQSDEVRPPHLSPRTRLSPGSQGGVFSHLPLHSQQQAWTPNLMIPIGGIHMLQSRTSPLYSLVTGPMVGQNIPSLAGMDRPAVAQNTPTPTEMDCPRKAGLDISPLCSPSPLKHRQSTLKVAAKPGTSMHTSDHAIRTGEGAADKAGCSYLGPLPDKPGTAHVQVYSRRQEHHGSRNQREKTKLQFTGTEKGGSSHTTAAQTSNLSKETTDAKKDTNIK
ncbi:transcription factor HIVEP3 isoform X2 [Esox lucius]|uniref:transcription factor HIVEP3 isoform X2 n=1 Tax=Esox lucius TaxID=8010 RepID=UPI0014771A98|nr:transcription factor HIVEP3 isoform X2 [Esox lucius]